MANKNMKKCQRLMPEYISLDMAEKLWPVNYPKLVARLTRKAKNGKVRSE